MDSTLVIWVVSVVLAVMCLVVVAVVILRKSPALAPTSASLQPQIQPQIQPQVQSQIQSQTQIVLPNIAAITARIAKAKSQIYAISAVRSPKVKFLCYVNEGDNVLADETPGFVDAAKAFFRTMKGRFCWDDANSTVFYANAYNTPTYARALKFVGLTPAQFAQILWNLAITTFFANLSVGDTLVFFLLTHGGVNDKGVEFILGGLDENTMTALAQKIPSGVNLILYSAGCDQSRPIQLPIHFTVDSAGRRIVYKDANRQNNLIKANIMTLTDTWSGYLSQFEPPTFYKPTSLAFTAILLNFLSTKRDIATVDKLFTAYAQSGWHRLRSDDAISGDSALVIDNIVTGKWSMFRPVLGLSSLNMLMSPNPMVCR